MENVDGSTLTQVFSVLGYLFIGVANVVQGAGESVILAVEQACNARGLEMQINSHYIPADGDVCVDQAFGNPPREVTVMPIGN